MITRGPYLAGGNAGRQSPPGGWSWRSPSRRWKGREGQACRAPVPPIAGAPHPQAPPPASQDHLSPTSMSPALADPISPSSGSGSPVFQLSPCTHTSLTPVHVAEADLSYPPPSGLQEWAPDPGLEDHHMTLFWTMTQAEPVRLNY